MSLVHHTARRIRKHVGFSLVEIMVIISILTIILTIGVIQYNELLSSARDSERQQVTQQFAKVLDVYETVVGNLPDCENGATISRSNGTVVVDAGTGTCVDQASLQSFLNNNLKQNINDPANDPTRYFYYYDSDHSCNGEAKAVVFSHLEVPAGSNASEICPQVGQSDGAYTEYGAGDPSYPFVVIVGNAR